MTGIEWCLSLLFVGMIFTACLVVSGGLIIGMYFDAKQRDRLDRLKRVNEGLKKLLEMVKKEGQNSGENE